jgi:transposase
VKGVEHAILCGEALIAARAFVPDGQWCRWVDENLDFGIAVVGNWMRIAKNRDQLTDNETTQKAALLRFKELGIREPRGGHRQPSFDVAEARALRSQGMATKDLAEMFGVHQNTMRIHLDPQALKKHHAATRRAARVREKERQALVKQERDEAVKRVGGDISVIYAWLLKAAIMVDRAIVESDDTDYCDYLRDARAGMTRAENSILKALKIK